MAARPRGRPGTHFLRRVLIMLGISDSNYRFLTESAPAALGLLARWAAVVASVVALAGCATSLERGEFEEVYSIRPPLDEPVWQAVSHATLGKGPDWFVPLNLGIDALRMRLALIDSATRSIDAKYFIWTEDHTGSLLLERIIAAADRGVRVRLLIDDVELSESTSQWVAADAHPNVSVRIYNPFANRAGGAMARFIDNLNDLARVNHRMHNKALIADNTVAMIGGRNVADEYHGFGESANFRDFDLVVGGQVVPAISSTYDHFWNSGWAFPAALVEPDDAHDENALAVLRANLADRELILEPMLQKNNAEFHDWRDELVAKVAGAISGSATVLVDRPDIHDPEPAEQVSSKLKAAIDQVQEEIVVVTPYLVPPPGYMDSVWELESRDVEMIILTNSLNTNNHVSVHAGYSHHRGDLLEAGVDLHEYRLDAEARQKYEAEGYRADSFTVHAKVLVMDRRQVFVGTFNMDPRSMFINTELGLLIDSPELAKVIRDYVLVDFQPDNSWKVIRHEDGSLRWVDSEQSLDREPSVSTWRRFQAWLLGLFPIENQL
jgi:putative cardiolipin synthase